MNYETPVESTIVLDTDMIVDYHQLNFKNKTN